MKNFLLSLLLLGLHYRANAFSITVDSHAEECFFERVELNTKMGLTFEIAEGGFLDIDVRVVGPDGLARLQGEQEGQGRYTFAADVPGEYTYCFSNKKSTRTPKVVMFNMEVSEAPKPVAEHEKSADGHEATNGNPASLDSMIKDLSAGLREVKSQQEYMQIRDRIHRSINESTNFRVVLWSIFEATVLLAMTLGQVYYLKRFFEVRRVV
ncbi:transmembrane emp24 domain-containing protein 2 [Venturia canescens]|uniref:transmembrane emp24 domain-containing protein 2 n=1 Tax=Venturia canescens TaxID=32260 RepID=UPI001C9C7462|nr:transmembrane emp24 domain-containing protein 2 [Venturia canescens]